MTPLSPRMITIAELVVRGYSNKKIARELGLTVNTVAVYVVRSAARIEGDGSPRSKIYRWWYTSRQLAA
jgi:DNA-binding CsgD family transcriptional regulator